MRTFLLTPSDICTTKVLDYVISEQMKGATDGSMAEDPDQSPKRKFLDARFFSG